MARWSYLTGMRESNMLALKLSAACEAGVTYTPVKARKNKPAVPILIEWSDELRSVWRLAAGMRIGAQPLFPTTSGGFYSRDSFQSLWQRWRKRVGIEDLRWHDIRRKAGSDSDSDATATDLLAHSDGAVTRKHYRVKPHAVKPLK
ncbi:MAG: tyrosine-type recombinase/integrase [Rudaea sp.]